MTTHINLQSLGVEKLTSMQKEMGLTAVHSSHIVLLSPTGTGKTLAFTLPMLSIANASACTLQAVVIVPTRELAQQDEEVLRRLKTGLKSMCLYGGRPAMEEHRALKEMKPQVIYATPGRMMDHLDKGNVDGSSVSLLIIDEFDKCVELGFQDEMERLTQRFGTVSHCWLTSATDAAEIPAFIENIGRGKQGGPHPTWTRVDYLSTHDAVEQRMHVSIVDVPEKDKLETLGHLLTSLNGAPAIVFVSHRESVERICLWLHAQRFYAEAYHGGLEQDTRERALYKFRSGSANVLVSTDLAARGLDIPEVEAVIHYHLPLKLEDFTHRNGRTARWNAHGRVFLLKGPQETLPEFVSAEEMEHLHFSPEERLRASKPRFVSVYIGRGKRDKLSKADVLGFLCKKGGAKATEIGRIDVGAHHAYVALLRAKAKDVLARVAGEKIKGMKTLVEEMRK